MPQKVLVTGGCGYIGSHIVYKLSERGYEVIVLDNLSTGFRDSLLGNELLVEMDLADRASLDQLFSSIKFDAVIHLAASIVVPESVADPIGYYENNTKNTINLLKTCNKYGVNRFIFSSTAAVYGQGLNHNCHEDSPLNPINPYARSKLMSEWILQDLSAASDLKFVIMRYFNVAGADSKGRLGQRSQSSTHLIKVICETLLGKRSRIVVFGNDYDTPDGTCIRDYIHVEDLALAHLDAFEHLMENGDSDIFNCGYGTGYSVKDVIGTTERVFGRKLPVEMGSRRSGDASFVVANPEKIKKKLGWVPYHNKLEEIILSSYDWEKRLNEILGQPLLSYDAPCLFHEIS
ncbi:MAG: UDP-glucose 4-epimerase GalE [Oligoflexales bacterium]|nr:UDP-glucose 4-epimerase GalE [Oligoflexales bacterium]